MIKSLLVAQNFSKLLPWCNPLDLIDMSMVAASYSCNSIHEHTHDYHRISLSNRLIWLLIDCQHFYSARELIDFRSALHFCKWFQASNYYLCKTLLLVYCLCRVDNDAISSMHKLKLEAWALNCRWSRLMNAGTARLESRLIRIGAIYIFGNFFLQIKARARQIQQSSSGSTLSVSVDWHLLVQTLSESVTIITWKLLLALQFVRR